jgi:hypothetical protein
MPRRLLLDSASVQGANASLEVRFRERSELDVGGIDVVIEVRSKWSESRAVDRQQRCDQLLGEVKQATGLDALGVYLTLPIAAWSQ